MSEKASKKEFFIPILYLRKLLRVKANLNVALLSAKIPLMVYKYEILPNLVYLNLNYSTFQKGAYNLVTYNFRAQKAIIESQFQKKVDAETYVEQLYDYKLSIVGGQEKSEQANRFELFSKQQTTELQTKYSRQSSRTQFDSKRFIYIIGGQNQKHNEVFDLNTQKYRMTIAKLKQSVRTFGLSFNQKESLYIFGGYSEQSSKDILSLNLFRNQ